MLFQNKKYLQNYTPTFMIFLNKHKIIDFNEIYFLKLNL